MLGEHFTNVRLRSTGELFCAHRYAIDPEKFTLYDINSLEPVKNAYKYDVDLISYRYVVLAGRGGKNARKRQILGKIQHIRERHDTGWVDPQELSDKKFGTTDIQVQVPGRWVRKKVFGKYVSDYRDYWVTKLTYQAIVVKSMDDWNWLCEQYPITIDQKEISKSVREGYEYTMNLVR